MTRPSDWDAVFGISDPTPGDPWSIRSMQRSWSELADDAERAESKLRQLLGDEAISGWIGEGGNAFRDKTYDLPDQLGKCHRSYRLAADALLTWASRLETHQGDADRALVQGRAAKADLDAASSSVTSASGSDVLAFLERYADTPPPASVTPPSEEAIRTARARLSSAQSAQHGAQSRLDAARQLALDAGSLREEDGRTAARAVREASDAGIPERSRWEKFKDWAADAWDIIVEICKIVVLVLGVVALIIGGPLAWVVFAAALLLTPWNLPAAMITRKIAPALAAGCTVVVKPSFQTPLTALYLAQIADKVGVPAGVINVIPTTRDIEVVGDLIAQGPVRALSFTGSTRVGSQLLAQASARVLKCSMELGGNAPFVVFDDADLDEVISGALVAKMRHNAEACTAANRFLVHRSIYDQFVERLTAALGQLKVGPGTDAEVNVGPLASSAALASVRAAVDTAVAAGAREVTCGQSPSDGYYLAPTLLLDIEPDAAVLQHEMFAPVAPVVSFDTEDEAVRLANGTDMGLASYVYSADLARALRVAERIDAGMVGVNTGILSDPAAPFGGTKHSGLGREGGRHGITEFLETKYIAVTW